MFALREDELGGPIGWVDTGCEQLIVPLAAREAVDRCQPDPRLLSRHASNREHQPFAYVWARGDDAQVFSRFFFMQYGAVIEDPGTGSACANLGGWLLATDAPLPVDLSVRQGEKTGRRCRLRLRVDAGKRILVSGRVIEVGRGELRVRRGFSSSSPVFAELELLGPFTG